MPLLFGLFGAAVLVGLGVWQMQRLDWKRGVLAEISTRIAAPPVSLPASPDPARDRYLPVTVAGTLTGAEAHVLTSLKDIGPGYRVIAALEVPVGRRILVDLGFVAAADLAAPGNPTPRLSGLLTFNGNLHWPDEVDSFTPPYDAKADIWFARDVNAMAAALKTEPVLVVARSTSPALPGLTPQPVNSAGIANDHLQYAITWFCLAAVWLGMTALLLWRIRQRTN